MGSMVVWFLLFNGRQGDIPLFQHQSNLKKDHRLRYPFQKMKHVLDLSTRVASTHLAPVSGKGLPAKQEATPSSPQGLGPLDAMKSYCKVLLYCFSLEQR